MMYNVLFEALTPVSHGDASANDNSNVNLFMRQNRVIEGIPMPVPHCSENALRSVVLRSTLAKHLIKTLNLETKSLPKTVVNLLFSGGNLMKGAKSPSGEFEIARNVFAAFPSIELLGGAVDDFVLPAGRLRLCSWIVAKEYAPALERVASADIVSRAKQVSAFDLLSEETRTRGTGEQSDGNQMVYTYEVLASGSQVFVEVFIDDFASELAASAAGLAFSDFDGFFGGQGRQGRGRMAIVSSNLPSGDMYHQYISDNADKLKAELINGTLGGGCVLCGGK